MFSILTDFLNVAIFLPFRKVDEEDIGHGLRSLKKESWFQQFLTNDKFRSLIVHDRDIRNLIGKCKPNHLNKERYANAFRRRLHKLLVKKTTAPVA